MKTELFISLELAALAMPLLAIAASMLVQGPLKRGLVLVGHVAALILSSTAWLLSVSLSQTDLAAVNIGAMSARFDMVNSSLIMAITFIAAVVAVFSERYLGGEKSRSLFLYGLSFLSSCSAMIVASDNMIVTFAFWHLLSWGLWWTMRLQDDVAAKRSARVVLQNHLLSDMAIGAAILIMYNATKTVSSSQIPQVLPLLETPVFGSVSLSAGMLASLLIVLAFSIKSALFPFHRWLVSTLDAPTPLSGLLHAGVVNVSAVVALRMMPLLQDNSAVLVCWAVLSAFSAILGTLSSSSQPDVKKKLVYSTVGQMGFMSLQCASGAVGAALFHLVAHGMFKCHMFLQSGNAVGEGLTKRKFATPGIELKRSGLQAGLLIAVTAVACGLAVYFLSAATGWTALSTLVAAAAVLTVLPAFQRIDIKSLCLFWAATLLVVLASAAANSQFETLSRVEHASTSIVMPACVGIFALLAITLRLINKSSFAKALYVHSLNGFYAGDAALSLRKPQQHHSKTH